MANRLYYLDYLRVFLTFLVILHHTAIAYGAGGSWIYVDVDQSELTITSILLTLFTAVNQSFFMGLFFFLSGYFTPGAFDRKGAKMFLKERFIRLGIPLLFYVFFLGPVIYYIAHYRYQFTLLEYYQSHILTFRQIHIGPLWFVEALLIFCFIYSLLRWLSAPRSTRVLPSPAMKTLLFFAIGMGLTAFLVRFIFPVGTGVLGLQFGYFPSYIVLFTAGILAYRGQWLNHLTPSLVKTWWRISLVSIPLLPIVFILTGALEGNLMFEGGANVQSFFYAIWEPFVAFGIILWLLQYFNRAWNQPTPFRTLLGQLAYTVFIIHPAVVVGFSLLLTGVDLLPLMKFVLVGFFSTVTCFIIASILIKLPYAKKIL
ncbi:acyltransferase family protein [Ammoniphilus sp. CFH 90114]|uniref:acyltransferase family protein n=1 Tax=Ammoniphilus sp. CFH 90114 TaxID=2493665 RepID=UPI00100FF18E|nr:acyltransferase family protein [Ammoniphilus sp. CFH 90114]RXT03797.1 acyltransferase [Ammoniphilus sp. CFH 90114]